MATKQKTKTNRVFLIDTYNDEVTTYNSIEEAKKQIETILDDCDDTEYADCIDTLFIVPEDNTIRIKDVKKNAISIIYHE